MPINIPNTQLSRCYTWELLDIDASAIGVRPEPSYENEPMYYLDPGTEIKGYLYFDGLDPENLEVAIDANLYKKQHYFVILKDRSGCIAVIGKLGHRLLEVTDYYPEPVRQQPVYRPPPVDHGLIAFNQRMMQRKAEDRARHERHKSVAKAFFSAFAPKPKTESTTTARDQELRELREKAAYLQQYCNYDDACYYNPYELRQLEEVRARIKYLEQS